MAKLTLSVDDRVIGRAKLYAKQRGASVSELVETYLSAVAEPAVRTRNAAPVLRSVRGIIKQGSLDDYREHVTAKYR